MAKYDLPKLAKPPKAGKKQVLLVASGDLRLSANQACWPSPEGDGRRSGQGRRRGRLRAGPRPSLQARREARLHRLAEGRHVRLRRHRSRRQADRGRGRRGSIRTTCWPGCSATEGPILTVANWSGTWPGLVGMLNLNAC